MYKNWLLLAPALLTILARLGAASDPVADWDRMKDIVPRGYICTRATNAPVIDGRLDDAAWAAAPWTEDFVDIEGSAKPKPRFRTRARMLWDDQFFYIGAELEEPHVWGTLTNHDAVIFQDPDFEVFIDPDGDSHEYYEFEINALNTGWDLYLPKPYKDGGTADNNWSIPGLKTGVHIRGTLNKADDRDEGWTVELAFPWSVLGARANRPAPPREGDQWRVGFSRVEWDIDTSAGTYRKVPKRPEHNWIWSPQGIIDMHRPERWGYVQFTSRPAASVALAPDPSRTARDFLQGVYYAQRKFRATHGRWAGTFDDLGWAAELRRNGDLKASLELTPRGYLVSAEAPGVSGGRQRWTIDQESRVRPATLPVSGDTAR